MNIPYLPRMEKDPNFFDKTTIILIVLLCLSIFFGVKSCRAEVVDIERLADAIYYAEGGANTRFPYGILAKYKTTTPRQACINTIKSNLKRWNGEGDFISFLGKTYCPVGAKNDPTGLNRNWVRNVTKLYRKYANV
ncbi:MAG TPA: hypothetical protein PKM71_07985 [Candidatus Cloacimonas sp.]|nr:hypothetical protein [Candidatus Cloacimonas sp.]